VQADWLEARCRDSDLQIIDRTTYLLPAEATSGTPYRIVRGKSEYYAAYIPGVAFVDLQGELSDNTCGAVEKRYLLLRWRISATVDLFLRYQLGYEHLTPYNGSMREGARDTSLPIETD
jgi:3-mercaptopyruvate sulfurtransferase SseA